MLQVGDIANVAADLAAALGTENRWESIPAPVAELARSSKLARLVDLPRRALATRAGVKAALAVNRPDVVHLHWARYAPFIDAGGIPLVVHVHGSDARFRGSSLAGRLVARSLRRAAAVLVSTPDLLEHVPPGARYLPNPVDVGRFAPGAEAHPSVGVAPVGGEGRPVVFLFARLTAIKGAEQLVAVASAIRSADPSIRVQAISGGTFDAEAAAVGVELLAPRARDELVDVIRGADVVVGQQRLGILSLSELEAMSCARPVVMPLREDLYALRVPVVVAPRTGDVADACVALLADPRRRVDIGERARRYVSDHHGPAVVARQLVELYESLV